MGTWSSPFDSKDKALKLKEKMKNPWILKDNDAEDLYDLVGCDHLYDSLLEYEDGTDIRFLVKKVLDEWIEEIDSFFHVDDESLKIVKDIIKEYEV